MSNKNHKVCFSVSKITVVINTYSSDRVFLHTDEPAAIPSTPSGWNLLLSFDAQQGTGVDYCSQHYPGVPVEVVSQSARLAK